MKNKIIFGLIFLAMILIGGWILSSIKSQSLVKGFSTDITNVSIASPTIATSTGIGTTASSTNGAAVAYVYGNSTFMVVSVATGNAPAANAVIATTTVAFSCPNYVVPDFSFGNLKSAGLSSTSAEIYMATSSPNTFTINSGNTGLQATTTYTWDIFTGCN